MYSINWAIGAESQANVQIFAHFVEGACFKNPDTKRRDMARVSDCEVVLTDLFRRGGLSDGDEDNDDDDDDDDEGEEEDEEEEKEEEEDEVEEEEEDEEDALKEPRSVATLMSADGK